MSGPAEIILTLLARHKAGQYIEPKEAKQALSQWPDGQPIPPKIWDAMAVLAPIAARYVPDVPTQSEFYAKEMAAFLDRARFDSWQAVNRINRRLTLAQLLVWSIPLALFGIKRYMAVPLAIAFHVVFLAFILVNWAKNEWKNSRRETVSHVEDWKRIWRNHKKQEFKVKHIRAHQKGEIWTNYVDKK